MVVFLNEWRGSLGNDEFVGIGNRRDLVFCPRDQGGAFGVVGVGGACNVGGVVVVVGTIGVGICGGSGASCESSSHST